VQIFECVLVFFSNLVSYICIKLAKPLDKVNIFWWFIILLLVRRGCVFSDNTFSHDYETVLDLFDGIVLNRSKILLGFVNYWMNEGYACLNLLICFWHVRLLDLFCYKKNFFYFPFSCMR
jgi:hypothetical protein